MPEIGTSSRAASARTRAERRLRLSGTGEHGQCGNRERDGQRCTHGGWHRAPPWAECVEHTTDTQKRETMSESELNEPRVSSQEGARGGGRLKDHVQSLLARRTAFLSRARSTIRRLSLESASFQPTISSSERPQPIQISSSSRQHVRMHGEKTSSSGPGLSPAVIGSRSQRDVPSASATRRHRAVSNRDSLRARRMLGCRSAADPTARSSSVKKSREQIGASTPYTNGP